MGIEPFFYIKLGVYGISEQEDDLSEQGWTATEQAGNISI